MPRILIYDSGVGNRPIADAIETQLPQSELHLLSDTAFFPYGEKSEGQLLQRISHILERAIEIIKPDLLVLACNTLSTIALQQVRDAYAIPVIGVVPAIKPAALASRSKVIGLLATPATIDRRYTNELIEQFAGDCQVIKVGSTALVRLAEQFYAENKLDLKELESVLLPFIEARDSLNLDQLILGCTHFPLLREPITEIMHDVEIQDSSLAIGKQALRLTSEYALSESHPVRKCYATTEAGEILPLESND